MGYQKKINLLDNAPHQPTKFRTKNWVETNDGSYRVYNIGSQIKFKTSMLKSILWDDSDANILVKGSITVPNTRTTAVNNNRNKKVIFKISAPFIDFINEIDNKEIGNTKDIDDVVMPMYNLIEYSHSYSKTSGSLWQYYRD